MTRRAAFAAILALSLASCGDGGGGGAGDAEPVRTDTVDLPKSYRFEPAAIEVDAGTTVTWTNNDDFPHNVTVLEGMEASEDLPIGESATITFDEPGEFPYECSLHPQQMQGSVVVV